MLITLSTLRTVFVVGLILMCLLRCLQKDKDRVILSFLLHLGVAGWGKFQALGRSISARILKTLWCNSPAPYHAPHLERRPLMSLETITQQIAATLLVAQQCPQCGTLFIPATEDEAEIECPECQAHWVTQSEMRTTLAYPGIWM